MHPFLLTIISICLSVAAQFLLKAGMSGNIVKQVPANSLSMSTLVTIFTQPYILGGFLLYGLGALVWLSVLSRWDVSKAYPLVGMGFVMTVLIGLATGEQINLLRVAGVVLICAGVCLIAQS